MSYNFHTVDREQAYLMPPSMEDWLPENHLAWFILDAVETFDMSDFLNAYRNDGTGNTAFSPRMMLALLVYAYCNGTLSSRKIEALCQEHVAYRVIAANHRPDHATIARFRKEHLAAFRSVFVSVLRLCGEAGLVKVGKIAVDGTKIKANASLEANRTQESIEKEVAALLAQAQTVDAQENKTHGTQRGDELPPELSRRGADRLARLKACQKKIQEDVSKVQEEASKKVEERAKKEREAAKEGKKLRGRKPAQQKQPEAAKANTTDPESRMMKSKKGYVQGYNAQASVCDNGIVVAAEVTQQETDQHQFVPMIQAARETLDQAGIRNEIGMALADAGYCSEANLRAQIPVQDRLLATCNGRKLAKAEPLLEPALPGESAREAMERRLRTPEGKQTYRRRGAIVENRFGVAKEIHRFTSVSGRGKTFAQGEWSLICAVMNLKRLYLLKGANIEFN